MSESPQLSAHDVALWLRQHQPSASPRNDLPRRNLLAIKLQWRRQNERHSFRRFGLLLADNPTFIGQVFVRVSARIACIEVGGVQVLGKRALAREHRTAQIVQRKT